MSNLSLTMQQLDAIKTMLDGEDDDRLLNDMIEGSTDAIEIARGLLAASDDDEGAIAALDRQVADRQARKKRAQDRIARRREVLTAMMQAAGAKKLTLPEASLSLRDGKAALRVVSDDAVPEAFKVAKLTTCKTAINAEYENATTLPNWLTRDEAKPVLTVRRA